MNNVLEILLKAQKFKVTGDYKHYEISFLNTKKGDFYAKINRDYNSIKYCIYTPKDNILPNQTNEVQLDARQAELQLNELKEFCEMVVELDIRLYNGLGKLLKIKGEPNETSNI